MNRVLGIDFETTGLDFKKDRIVEVGAVVWDVERKTPLKMFSDLLIDDGIRIRMKDADAKGIVQEISGLSEEDLERFGSSAVVALDHIAVMAELYGIDYVVAHNGQGFDKPFLREEQTKIGLKCQYLLDRPWIDTRLDLPFEKEPSSRRLTHLTADHGFINPFEHRALFDVLSMLKLMSCYDFPAIAAQSAIPFVTVRAMVGYEERQLAKDARFSWEKLGEKMYPKCWVKEIRANKVEEFTKACGFQVVQLN